MGTLQRFPPPHVDEAWTASRGWEVIQTGKPISSLDAGPMDRLEGHWTFYPRLPAWFQAVGYSFAERPSLLQARLVSLVFGLLLLVAIYSIGLSVGGRGLALAGVVLVGGSRAFCFSGHMARPDMMSAALGFLAIALAVRHPSAPRWQFLAGLLVGLAFEIHPNAAIYGPTVLVLHAHERGWGSLLRRRTRWFVGGVTLGLAYYAALHVIPFPDTYFAISRDVYGPTHLPPLASLDPVTILRGLTDLGYLLLVCYTAVVALVGVAAWSALRHGSRSQRRLLVLGAVLAGVFALWVRNKLPYYAIYFTPGLDLLLATLTIGYWNRAGGLEAPRIKKAVAVLLLAVPLLPGLQLLAEGPGQESMEHTQARIEAVVEPSDTVVAPQWYWFGLHQQRYLSWQMLILHRRFVPGATLEEALRSLDTDVLIIDGHLLTAVKDEEAVESDVRFQHQVHLTLQRRELDPILSRYGTVVDEFDGGTQGPVKVYRFDWSKRPNQRE